jgi:hypothetical protein
LRIKEQETRLNLHEHDDDDDDDDDDDEISIFIDLLARYNVLEEWTNHSLLLIGIVRNKYTMRVKCRVFKWSIYLPLGFRGSIETTKYKCIFILSLSVDKLVFRRVRRFAKSD